jgi:hypothetical protein
LFLHHAGGIIAMRVCSGNDKRWVIAQQHFERLPEPVVVFKYYNTVLHS